MRSIDTARNTLAIMEHDGTKPSFHELSKALDAIEAELADHYVELPVDADGEHIHIGDVMDNTHKDGFRAKRVTGICYHEGGHMTIEVDEVRLRWHDAGKLRHHHEPTVEDVLRDLSDEVWNRCCEGMAASDSGIDGIIAEYAKRLRLAGEDE